jgi:hypothetical protein
MERDLESLYDLLLAIPTNMYSKSDSEGSCPPLRECNMLHLLADGVVPAKDAEDDAYPIRRTLENRPSTTRSAWSEPGHEKLIRTMQVVNTGTLAPNTLTLRGAWARAHHVYDQI